MSHLKSLLACAAAAAMTLPFAARAEVPVQRTFFRLPSSNGHGAVLLDLSQGRLTHFREHLFATEEPELDALGAEVWNGSQFGSVFTRDLLYDAYFGIRFAGDQAWLTSAPVDLDASGYAAWAPGKTGGTGVATMVQTLGPLQTTQYFFAPQTLPHAGLVMAMRVKNTSAQAVSSVSAFSLHNFHLGFGRPGAMNDIGEQGETVSFDGSGGKADLIEKAFAGAVVARALGAPSHHGASNAASGASANLYQIVQNGGTTDFPDLNGAAAAADGSISGYQFDLGDLAPNQEKWVGVAFAHHGDPFAEATVQGWLDAYVAGADAASLVNAEIASWSSFQSSGLNVPTGLEAGEEDLLRQSAVMLRMGQVKEQESFLREFLTIDGEPRYTRFGTTLGGPAATLPATVQHHGAGAVIASLPPGEWTYAWIRDGAYATVAMAELGMQTEAHDALQYYLGAEAGRFQSWSELSAYSMPPYQISLVRYHGFGVEETDFNGFGPNLEFDGFGLFLWALRAYEQATGDTSVADGGWPVVASKVADVLVALIDPVTGLIRPDSSIWESHWNGRERTWAYTSITAARGLCDAADIADRLGDSARASLYKDAGNKLRAAIAAKLTDASGGIASTTEELAVGEGYWDAAVLDAIAMGLFDPNGKIAKATLEGLDQHLAAPAGAGWSRNDDNKDHAGATDVSPWGSDYDSAEWVVTDLRGAIATRMAGDTTRSDRLLSWVRDQSVANYLAVAETYDENTGTYKFNAPMLGFGAGVYSLALLFREGDAPVSPACGAYFDEGGTTTTTTTSTAATGAGGAGEGGAAASSASVAASSGSASGGAGGGGAETDDGGCGCRIEKAGDAEGASGLLVMSAGALFATIRRRRRQRAARGAP